MTIRPAHPDEMHLVRALFLEYAESLGFSLCFQGFQQELDELPGKYGQPSGVLLLAFDGELPVGVVGLRPLSESSAEMKRLYIKPAARGHHLGRRLVERLEEEARQRGYRSIKLDTVPSMEAARELYVRMGFVTIPAYYDNSPCGSICMEKHLGGGQSA
ncbi:MAG: GNAT family N-acetyltransferase [Gemmatales bacterium]